MQDPLVTVIMVCWNHERFVRSSILSVMRQTYSNQQVIVFDNDSADGSRAVIESLAGEYGFQFIHQPNVGVVKTLNRGLALAKGKYFAMIATDDLWLLDKIERQVTFMEAHPNVFLCCGNTVTIDEEDCLTGLTSNNRAAMPVSFRDLMVRGNCVHGPTVMVRTQSLVDLGGYDERFLVEDFTLALRLTYEGHAVVHTGLLLALYRRHNANWTNMPFFEVNLAIGQAYRYTPEYPAFVKNHLRGYFRALAGSNKRKAIEILRTEPIEWSWFDVGVGLLKLLMPRFLIKALRKRHTSMSE